MDRPPLQRKTQRDFHLMVKDPITNKCALLVKSMKLHLIDQL